MSDPLQFFGPYRVVRTLARGGMAEIFLAKKEGPAGFSKSVVVKRILPEHSGNEDFVQMFRDEARLAAQLEHPNIVHITDFGEVQGSYFLAMEYLQGSDLGSLLRARQKAGLGPFPPTLTAFIGSLACSGLHYAHTSIGEDGRPLRIVHRDISPNNLFLTYQGAVKVLDFGIAKAEGKLVQTRAGLVKGKLLYMSPEQTWGKVLDARSDVWALGVVLYEVLTGKRPFFRSGEADAREMNERLTMEAIDREEPPPPSSAAPGVPAELDAIVLKCLAKSAGARWQSAADLQLALESFVTNQGGATATTLAQLIEASVGADQVRAATQRTPSARQVAVDPQAAVATQFKPAADPQVHVATRLQPAADPQVHAATRLQPAASESTALKPPAMPGSGDEQATRLKLAPATGPDDEATRLKPLRQEESGEAPVRPRRGPGLAIALVLLVGALGAAGWYLTRDPERLAPGPVVAPPVSAVPEAGDAAAVVEAAPVVDAGEPVAAVEPADAGTSPVVEATPADAEALTGTPTSPVGKKVARRVSPPTPRKGPRQVGRLTVNCTPYGTVLVDDKERGRASPQLSLELPVGSHRIRCTHPSFGESTTTVVIAADQTVEKRLRY